MQKIKLSKILKQILLILSILIFDQVNSYAGDCPLTINSPLTSGCSVQSSGLEITSGGSLIIPSGSSFNLQITRVVTGSIINSGEIHGLNSQVLIQKNINGGFTNTLTGNIHGNRPFNIEDYSTVNSFSNAGFIGTAATTINHYGGVIDLWGGGGILNGAHITGGFTNSGDIKAVLSADGFLDGSGNRRDASGIRLVFSTDSITGGIYNSGTIASASGDGIQNGGLIDSITNTGTITGSGYGISNYNWELVRRNIGTIGTLNNSQGALSSALTYQGNLPTNYNIIINSTSNYGQLAVNSGSGTMAFNIYGYTGQTLTSGVSASSVSNNHRYQNALAGLVGTLSGSTITGTGFSITGAKGSYGGYSYTLVADDSNVSGVWDLLFGSLGPSATDTQSSLTNLASRLRSIYNHQALTSNFLNSNTYDCNLFDVKGMCISAGGRYSTVDNPNSNSTAAVVTLGYKVNPNIRIGGFLDQSVNNNNPTGVHLSNSNPMMGAFAYWNQNPDGLGYQVKIANAYQDKDLSTTRDVIGTSEAGRGTTSLTTQSYVGELSYAFMYKENTLVRPYFALRHTKIEQDAYTETGVSTPLTYSALNDRTTSALMGVKFKHALTPKTNLTGSLGVEQDLHHKTDQLTASGVSGLTSENFSGDIHRTRPVASLGATYDIAKTQRLSGEVLVQQLPFQSTAGATAYFNYMIGF